MSYSHLSVTPEAHGFGATVTGLDLSRPLAPAVLAEVRAAWAVHGVLAFPGQPLSLDELERFTLQIGPFGVDPFIKPMPGHANILELRREANETVSNFGAAWHSDWSFQAEPPAATILHGAIIPPAGGDTLFSDCCRAYETLSPAMQALLAPLNAVHSARQAYGPNSLYARETGKRAMDIVISAEAEKTHAHPLVTRHPVTGRRVLFVNPVYTVGIEGMTYEESMAILGYLFQHQLREEFVYRHRWAPDMLLIWDNRCVNHMATGGYDGHLRVMHRTTVAGGRPSRDLLAGAGQNA